MGSLPNDDNTGSFNEDEEMKQIFQQLAKEFVKEENFLLPVVTTPVSSPPIDYLDFLGSLEESEKKIKRPKIEDGTNAKTEEAISVMDYSQHSAYPNKSYSQEKNQCDSEEEVTSCRSVCHKFRNNKSDTPSKSNEQARTIQMEMDDKKTSEGNTI